MEKESAVMYKIPDRARFIFHFLSTTYEWLFNGISGDIHYFCGKEGNAMRKLKVTEMNRLTTEAFKASRKIPLVVVLDHVRSLNNVGSVFRTSDAFRVEAIYLCGITACPPHAEIHKTALGAEESVDWLYFKDTMEAVEKLKAEGYVVCAIEQAEGSTMLDKLLLDKTKKYAVILGNEVKGVQQNVVDNCDMCVEIPQYGTKHSLNVSVTAGIVIWDFFQRLSD